MSDPSLFQSFGNAAPGITAGAGLIGTIGGLIQGRRNRRMQKKAFNLERYLSLHGTEVRAKDMQAAGLSKTLAAGGGATSQISTVPQGEDPQEKVMGMIAAMTQAADIAKTKAETRLAEATKDRVEADTNLISTTTEEKAFNLMLSREIRGFTIQSAKAAARLAQLKVDTEIYHQLNIRVDSALKKAQITATQKEALLKEVTFRLQKVLAETNEHNLRWFKSSGVGEGLGLPTTMGFDPFIRIINAGVRAILEAIKQVTPAGRKPVTIERVESSKKVDYSRSSGGRGGPTYDWNKLPEGFK